MPDVVAPDMAANKSSDQESPDSQELPGSQKSSDSQESPQESPDSIATSEPAKLMRIGTMIRSLLSEIHHAPLDEAGRDLMHDIYQNSVKELSQAMAEPLREELERLTLPFSSEVPSEAELRLAQAQLVGWLEGLFHGIQAAVAAQREMAEQQLRQMLNAPEENNADGGGSEPGSGDRGGVYL